MVNSSFLNVMYISVLLWIIYRIFIYIKNKKINLYREISLLLFFIYFLLLLNITIFKSSSISFRNPINSYEYKEYGISGIINFIPFVETIKTITDGYTPIINPLRNIFGNMLAFMPLGFFIPLLFSKYNNIKRIFLLGLISSLAIELVQLFVGYNVTDIDDVIYNTIGSILGLLCFKVFKYLVDNIYKSIKNTNDDIYDENILKEIKINNLIDRINDNQTYSILKKSLKVIITISLLVIFVYTYNVYEQTASDKLSDKEIAKEIFKNKFEKILDVKTLYNEKLYLLKTESGITVEKLQKYNNSRYAKSYESFSLLEENNNGYKINILHRFNEDMVEDEISVLVFGKNTNATSIIINLDGIECKTKINPNEYFLAVYPEYMQVDNEKINELYNGKNKELIKIKFLDENNNIINDIKLIKD